MATWKGRLTAVSGDPAADTSVMITIRWEHPDARQFTEQYQLVRATYPNLAAVQAMLNARAVAYDSSDTMREVVSSYIGQIVTS